MKEMTLLCTLKTVSEHHFPQRLWDKALIQVVLWDNLICVFPWESWKSQLVVSEQADPSAFTDKQSLFLKFMQKYCNPRANGCWKKKQLRFFNTNSMLKYGGKVYICVIKIKQIGKIRSALGLDGKKPRLYVSKNQSLATT